jgi:hypothetical protein
MGPPRTTCARAGTCRPGVAALQVADTSKGFELRQRIENLRNRLLDKVKNRLFGKLNTRLFNFAVRSIHATKSIACDKSSSVIVLSMCRHADMRMYLIAAKSFGRFVKPNHFIVVDDGLTESDRTELKSHIDDIRFIRTSAVDTGLCPRGGAWERLITISQFCGDYYVVQLDSDTVTISVPTEVIECIAANRSFTSGTGNGREIVPLAVASKFAKNIADSHVQIMAERVLEALPESESKFYVRGCAAFAGFHRRSITKSEIEAFSERMEKLVGRDTWWHWGSEQVTSNYMISNTDNPLVLPFETYPYWEPGRDVARARFVHFISLARFDGGEYLRWAGEVIKALR